MQTYRLTTEYNEHESLSFNNAQQDLMRQDNAEFNQDEFSDTIQHLLNKNNVLTRNDPRWMFAVRVQSALGDRIRFRSTSRREELVESAIQSGFSPIHASAIIAITEDAQTRKGLDHKAMIELLTIPSPDRAPLLSDRSRWIVFTALFGWACLIAGLMQLV
ncbi:MAG: hypothetical protein P1U42_04075 [Phycisphaerales bacterium]|nr:hypothetical protein [Phycisphaerales bacterium]